jgi:hypothetical protein
MNEIRRILDLVVSKLSDENYERSFAIYRFWFDIGQTYHPLPSDFALDAILKNRTTNSIDAGRGELIHPTVHLALRFASDVESDHILAPHNAGLQSRLCTRVLQDFIRDNLEIVRHGDEGTPVLNLTYEFFYTNTNLIARWANLGYVEEAAISNHILQSLIYTPHQKLYYHQADALIILFKLAGATFEAYGDPSAVDRCFELLEDHYSDNQVKRRLVQVRALPMVIGGHRAQTNF